MPKVSYEGEQRPSVEALLVLVEKKRELNYGGHMLGMPAQDYLEALAHHLRAYQRILEAVPEEVEHAALCLEDLSHLDKTTRQEKSDCCYAALKLRSLAAEIAGLRVIEVKLRTQIAVNTELKARLGG